MLTVREALGRAADQLAAHPELRPTALPDAAWLLMHLLGVDRAVLRAHPERRLERKQLAAYQALVERRLRFEPVQYIVGEVEWFGLRLRVAPGVLIPRPETELLVEAVLARVAPEARIVDVGTGSGAIAIALASRLPSSEIVALDLSADALRISAENAASNGATLRLVASDLLAAVEGPFDCVVSNPPYIPLADAPALAAQVRDWEPAEALFAGDSGLDIYRRLIPEAARKLRLGGLLALEIGFGQREAVLALLAGWRAVEVLDDLQGIARVVLARLASAD